MITGDAVLLRLLTWFSPSFPTGAFSYSHGLETAVEAGIVHDRDTLTAWLDTVVTQGSGFLDAVLFAAAHRAATDWDEPALRDVAELAAAHQATAEIAQESVNQGAAFLATVRAVWPAPALDRLTAAWDGKVTLPIAAAAACAASGVPAAPALVAYLHAFAANLVSAGVRVIPLGQTDGQAALAALEEPIATTAATAIDTPLVALATATPLVDWASASHETQQVRLFRS